MKILYDHQIFKLQKFGGVSRYFNELTDIKRTDVQMEKIDSNLIPDVGTPGKIIRGFNFIKKNIGIPVKKKETVLPLEITSKISKGDFDIFHPTYFDPYFLKLTQKPVVLTVYDMLHEVYPESFPTDKTSHNKRIVCEHAQKIIAISQTTKNALIDIFKIPEEKVHTIYLASDFDKIISSKPALSIGIDNFILFTGSRWSYKNFTFAVRAVSEILKSDKSIQFLCTGHSFHSDEIALFEELKIKDQVKHLFLKDDNELAWAYQNARCFIFPSLYEGFGFPLLEAFASNCPVVSSTGGSLKEIGGEGVIFFDPKNFKQIQDAISSVLYNPEVRNNLIIKGKKEFSKYSWDKCRSETIALYESILV